MSANYDKRRRCNKCREFHPVCDMNNHPVHSLICKKCFDNLKK